MALVFKCASDTIFLDDFKSVLDTIVANALSRVGGRAHRGHPRGQDQSHSQNIASPVPKADRLDFGPVVIIQSDNPRLNSRSMWKTKLLKPRGEGKPHQDMTIQQETTITMSNLTAKRDSNGSFGSGNRILPMPEPALPAQP